MDAAEPSRVPARRVLDGLYVVGAVAGGICLLAIAGLVIVQVIARWLGLPLAGMTELAGYAMAGSFFLPLAYAFRAAAHIRITLLIDRLGGASRWLAELLALAVGLGLAGYLAVFMVRMVHVSYLIGDLSQGADATPLWIPQTGMAAGAVLLAVALADTLVAHLLGMRAAGPQTVALNPS